jgi:hypothetical protein
VQSAADVTAPRIAEDAPRLVEQQDQYPPASSPDRPKQTGLTLVSLTSFLQAFAQLHSLRELRNRVIPHDSLSAQMPSSFSPYFADRGGGKTDPNNIAPIKYTHLSVDSPPATRARQSVSTLLHSRRRDPDPGQ